MKTLGVLLYFTLLFHACENSDNKHFLRVKGTHIVNASGDTVLLRGMGLGGWMLQEGYMFRLGFLGQEYKIRSSLEALAGQDSTERFYKAWLDHHTTQADIDSLAAWGFNSIRLPMHYQLLTLSVENEPIEGQNTWLEEGFARIDELLSWCKKAGVYLILDLHAAPGGQGHDLAISDRNPAYPSFWESEANRAKTIALWVKLAERYAHEPWIAGYDVLNEPNWGFEDPSDQLGVREKKNEPLRKFLVEVTQAIREVDPHHIIFIEGNGFGNNYEGIFPLWDDQLVVSFHKYGNPNTREAIQSFLDIREQHQVPIWLGESGENANTWFTEAIALCETHGIGWAWWQHKKMGINQPLEILEPMGYRRLIDYWTGKGEKPDTSEVHHIMGLWIENIRIANNLIHYDVLDALLRQPHTDETLPFPSREWDSYPTVLAVDFDLGKQRHAYYDLDTASYRFTPGVNTQGNRGHQYRNDGVDIAQDAEGPYIYHIEDGEWWKYTREFASNNFTHVGLWYRASKAGSIALRVDGKPWGNIISLPPTQDDRGWTYVEVAIPPISAGKHHLQWLAHEGGFEWKSFVFR
jgi:endoglucanase